VDEVSGGLGGFSQLSEVYDMAQVGVFLSHGQEVGGHLFVRLEEVFLEGAVGGFLEVLVLDILQVSSLLGGGDVLGASLDGFSLSLDAVDDAVSGGGDFVHESGFGALLSGELVIGTGFEGLATESGVVHEDGLEVLEGILAGSTEDGEGESGTVEAWEGEGLVSTADVESSEEGISPVVELEDESVVVLEVEDTEGADSTEDGGVASGLLDFSLFEEEGFDTLDHA